MGRTFRSLAGKLLRAVQRPQQLWQQLRCHGLFLVHSPLARLLLPGSRYRLEENVRIQSVASLLAADAGSGILIGRDSIIYESCRLEAYGTGRVEVGAGSILGGLRASARLKVTLGEQCLVSWGVFLQDHDPHPVEPGERQEQMRLMAGAFLPRFSTAEPKPRAQGDFPVNGEEIRIGNNVWIGANCTILKGARIGDGCVIGAGSVVLRGDYPAGSLIAGNPAKVKKRLTASALPRAA